jgi:hypothetical protein
MNACHVVQLTPTVASKLSHLLMVTPHRHLTILEEDPRNRAKVRRRARKPGRRLLENQWCWRGTRTLSSEEFDRIAGGPGRDVAERGGHVGMGMGERQIGVGSSIFIRLRRGELLSFTNTQRCDADVGRPYIRCMMS